MELTVTPGSKITCIRRLLNTSNSKLRTKKKQYYHEAVVTVFITVVKKFIFGNVIRFSTIKYVCKLISCE